MPTYQYRCTHCAHELEVVQKFTDSSLTVCPSCSGELRKVFNAVGVVFKGSGFYKTDSRGGTQGQDAKGSESKDSGKGDSGTKDSGKESGSKDPGSKGSGSKDAGPSKDAGSKSSGGKDSGGSTSAKSTASSTGS